jgi:hypothetical protein
MALPGAYAPSSIAVRVIGVRKPPFHNNVVVLIFILQLNSNFKYILENVILDYAEYRHIKHPNAEFNLENSIFLFPGFPWKSEFSIN